MKKLLEKDIEKAVCDYAKGRGCLAYKFTSPRRRSVPDRLFITPGGLVFFIEFKAPGKKPTDAQNREMGRLREKGVHVSWTDNIEIGKGIIDLLC